jgi:hypothetical protein
MLDFHYTLKIGVSRQFDKIVYFDEIVIFEEYVIFDILTFGAQTIKFEHMYRYVHITVYCTI